MSAKWIRSRKWDDQHLTGWRWPLKVLLRTFSGIPLAVVLLSLVAVYGILASVPIGLIALAPTYLLYGLTAVATVAVLAALPTALLWRTLGARGAGPAVRFPAALLTGLALVLAASAVWAVFLWPHLRYDAESHSGFRLFGSFVDAYKSVQFRRLPIMEMSELEFYAWWPLRLVLVLFVINMVVATVRRIEFSFPYIGVLTVHSGIVMIALGSIYYSSQKQEGDMLLLAGEPSADGTPAPGPPETGFYDNTRPALWVTQKPDEGWEQRPIPGLPRYNDYNLNALNLQNLPPMFRGDQPDRGPLDIRIPDGPEGAAAVDRDIRFRIVGYASYADLISQWVSESQAHTGRPGTALRTIEAYLAAKVDNEEAPDPARPRKTWRLMPDIPARRVDVLNAQGQDLLAIEYTRGDSGGRGMTEQRWKDLAVSLPLEARHALVVRHRATGFEQVFPVREGQTVTVGSTGFVLEVKSLSPTPPFPIITRGYEGARSSVAVVHVRPPAGKPAYERWIYSRFPEINQDLVDSAAGASAADAAAGAPMAGRRRAADPEIDIAYIDASIPQVYFDERPDGTVRSLVRLPRSGVSVTPSIAPGGSVEVSAGFSLKLADRLDDAVAVEYPFSTPAAMRETKSVGNHQRAAVAVEVSTDRGGGGGGGGWKSVVWMPFTQYARAQTSEAERTVALPDGRRVRLMFGRRRHEFWPPMGVRLADFTMIPYEHSQIPRDYRSDLVVMRRWASKFEDVRAKTSLNEPLLERTPFQAREGVPALFNAAARALSVIAPNQYKFSQAGWDQAGWSQSQQAVERGELKRPFARFTILGVGNNPGIYIIAAGAVMMSVGIPWAFYIKPLLVRRKKKAIQAAIQRGEIPVRPRAAAQALATPAAAGTNGTAGAHAASPAHPGAAAAPATDQETERA